MATESIAVESVKIEGLFEIFDYDVKYPLNENVLILTGPNGYGKTQVLNILANLFEKRLYFFTQLVFNKITVNLNNRTSIDIIKQANDDVEFVFAQDEARIEAYTYKSFKGDELRFDEYTILGKQARLQQVQRQIERQKALNTDTPTEIDNLQITAILDSINVHLIKEQRLFKQVKSEGLFGNDSTMVETIGAYADELKDLISKRTKESFDISQKLDSSYPTRLISEKKKVTKAEYDEKFAVLRQKQDKLVKHGLAQKSHAELDYSEDDAKALLVYLNDLEQKLAVFDDLIEKLELFTNILNERRFTFKSIQISKEQGFIFKTSTGSELKLNQLSSGEQHEVVLLFELIFKTSPSILVLIDEPEISLHITWQKEFLDDLLKIIKLQKFHVLIATHSPSIINSRWDLVYNLEKSDSE